MGYIWSWFAKPHERLTVFLSPVCLSVCPLFGDRIAYGQSYAGPLNSTEGISQFNLRYLVNYYITIMNRIQCLYLGGRDNWANQRARQRPEPRAHSYSERLTFSEISTLRPNYSFVSNIL